MTSPSDPLFEKFGAYIDHELPEDQRQEFERYLSRNPDSQKILDDLNTLNQLGDSVHDMMPGDAYFEDLPSRVLHRIQLEEAAAQRPVVAAGRAPGFWERLFAPAQTWRWAAATLVIGAVGLGAWFSQTGPDTPLATAPAVITEPGPAELAVASVNDQYVARVAETLGGYGNLGSTLDQGVPVREIVQPADDSIIQPVSFQDLTVPANDVDDLLPASGATVEQCFAVARLCEEQGNPTLARNGYRLVFQSKESQDDLFLAAQLGFVRSIWRDRIQRNPHTAQNLYGLLAAEANQGYQDHLAGNHSQCARIWAVTTAAHQLGMRNLDPEVLTQLGIQGTELKECAKFMVQYRRR